MLSADKIRYIFNKEKALEVISFLIFYNEGSLNCKKLLALLYLADRKALTESAISITTDSYMITGNGIIPVMYLSILKRMCLKENNTAMKQDGLYIISTETPTPCYTSQYELDILKEISDKYKDKESMSEVIRSLPEWHDTFGSAMPLYIKDIIEKAIPDEDGRNDCVEHLIIDADVQNSNYGILKELPL